MNYMVKINREAFKNWAHKNGYKMSRLSLEMGKSQNYLSGAVCRGEIASHTLQLLELKYGLDMKAVTAADEVERDEEGPVGFSVGLMVKPDRVRVAIMHNGEEMYSAFAKINGDTETKLVQAISYATHLCYKLAEQKELQGG